MDKNKTLMVVFGIILLLAVGYAVVDLGGEYLESRDYKLLGQANDELLGKIIEITFDCNTSKIITFVSDDRSVDLFNVACVNRVQNEEQND